ncbi:MAG: N-acetyltransferase [Pseudomonadota bacterium]
MATIRPYERERKVDDDALWALLEPVFRAGDTYAVERDVGRDAGLAYWRDPPHETFLCESGDALLGTYFLTPNQRGGGAHVCNCGFATAEAARGRGVARLMLEDALVRAKAGGYAAMQFNFVVETNERAVAIWRAYGFDVVGRLPGAFRHPDAGEVDALVMYKRL